MIASVTKILRIADLEDQRIAVGVGEPDRRERVEQQLSEGRGRECAALVADATLKL
jgi:hypothetical protein